MAGRVRSTGIAVSLVVVLLPLVGVSPLDAQPPGNAFWNVSEAGISAHVARTDCSDGGALWTCTTSEVMVSSTRNRAQGSGSTIRRAVCYSSSTESYDWDTFETVNSRWESGCTTVTGKATSIRQNLSAATIAATTINVVGVECGRDECSESWERAVTVSGRFTALGPTVRATYREFTDSGVCVRRISFNGSHRNARFSGTADGQLLSTDESASIGRGSRRVSATCPPDEG